MKVFSIEVDIAAPADRVWAIMLDGPSWPQWTPTVTEVRLLDPGPLAVGARALIRQPKLPPAVWRVTGLEPGRSFTWVTGGPGMGVVARHSVTPAATGCRVQLSVENSGLLGALLNWLTGTLTQRYLALEAAGLKQRAEGPPG
jgi:uncharacterized protein YndB with AHSA1/START domain